MTHRRRPHGASHYTFRNRSWKVVFDLIGVVWLLRRPIRFEVLAGPFETLPPAFAETKEAVSWT